MKALLFIVGELVIFLIALAICYGIWVVYGDSLTLGCVVCFFYVITANIYGNYILYDY